MVPNAIGGGTTFACFVLPSISFIHPKGFAFVRLNKTPPLIHKIIH